ncbi:uncharacterized protein LOC120427195 [Culex pipiens pallens]|uniref:uncharacterized protein LOC120427195 n=1 Tax=Culex pipiens pallens TaxID=42434 RepID=UPI001952CCB5|nr:uncharacterized protein LOC120427195 [Culex pipiens pallens]
MSPAALVDMDNVVRHGPLVGPNTGDQTVLSACRGQQYGKNRTAKDFSLSEKLNDHHGSRIHQNVNSASRNSQNVVGKLPEPVSVARECPTDKTDGVELVNMHVRCGSPCEASTSSRPLPAPCREVKLNRLRPPSFRFPSRFQEIVQKARRKQNIEYQINMSCKFTF